MHFIMKCLDIGTTSSSISSKLWFFILSSILPISYNLFIIRSTTNVLLSSGLLWKQSTLSPIAQISWWSFPLLPNIIAPSGNFEKLSKWTFRIPASSRSTRICSSTPYNTFWTQLILKNSFFNAIYSFPIYC